MVFTQQGLRLLAKVQAGAALPFTRVAVGDGYLETGQDETALTALIDQKMNLSISSIVVTDPQATICSVISNAGLSAGFYWREIGVFATDPNLGEILYGYDNAGSEATFVPPASENSFTAVCNIAIAVANASSVTATINPYLPAHEFTHVTGGSDPIPVATEAADGLFGHADKTKLDGIAAGATNNPLASATPTAEASGVAGAVGTSTTAARADHVHALPTLLALTTATPSMNGTAAAGTAATAAHGDHVHSTDTSRAPVASPALTGVPTAPTPATGTNSTQLATTAFVINEIGANPSGLIPVYNGSDPPGPAVGQMWLRSDY